MPRINLAQWNAYSAEDIGRHIAALRRMRDITQARFAEDLGVSRATLSALEHGRSVSATVLVKALNLLCSRIVVVPKTATVTVTEAPHG